MNNDIHAITTTLVWCRPEIKPPPRRADVLALCRHIPIGVVLISKCGEKFFNGDGAYILSEEMIAYAELPNEEAMERMFE